MTLESVSASICALPNSLLLAAADVVAVEVAVLLASLALSHGGWSLDAWQPSLAIAAAVALLLANAHQGLYDTVGQGPFERFRLRVAGATLMPWPTLGVVLVTGLPTRPTATLLALSWAALVPLGLLAEKLTRDSLMRRGRWGKRAVLLGSDEATRRLAAHLDAHPELGLRSVGRIAQEIAVTGAAPTPCGVPRLGSLADIERFAGIATVVVVAQSADMPSIEPMGLPFARVIVVPESVGLPSMCLAPCRMGEAFGFTFANRTDSMAGHRIKRLFDLCIALPALLLTLPLIGLLALLIKLISPGPAFYTQQRVGLRGAPVAIFKLRTMHVDAEARLRDMLAQDLSAREEWDRYMKLSRDPRVLPLLGNFMRRTSLDELPQLWNVVAGDISLVGPRPFPPYHVDKFDPAFQTLRSRVKPGLTGLWQVTERSNADLERQKAIDTFYIQNWSLWLDLYIVMQTLPAVLSTRGAR